MPLSDVEGGGWQKGFQQRHKFNFPGNLGAAPPRSKVMGISGSTHDQVIGQDLQLSIPVLQKRKSPLRSEVLVNACGGHQGRGRATLGTSDI